MATRFVKSSIWTSPTLDALSDRAELVFYRLLPAPDDHGCFLADPGALKGQILPNKAKWTVKAVARALVELVEAGLIDLWVDHERLYGKVRTWGKHQRIRSVYARRTPEPPSDNSGELNGASVLKYLSDFDIRCRQLRRIVSTLPPSPLPPPPSLFSLEKREKKIRKGAGFPQSTVENPVLPMGEAPRSEPESVRMRVCKEWISKKGA